MKPKADYIYTDGTIHPAERMNVSTTMQAFNYGTAAFEGMKAFYRRRENNWFIFRPDEHYRRLRRSTESLDIDLDWSLEDFIDIISRLIRKNNIKSDLYIRPLVYRNRRGVGLMKDSGFGCSVFLEPRALKPPRRLSCRLSSYRRPSNGMFNVKLSGNYVLSFMAQKEALAGRRDQAILLSDHGFVSEASVMNVFFLKNEKVRTPSLQCGCLDGITRKSVMGILKAAFGLKVTEGKYRYGSLLSADEAFLTGTGSGINIINKVDERSFSANTGNIAYRVYLTYRDIVYGKSDLFSNWMHGC